MNMRGVNKCPQWKGISVFTEEKGVGKVLVFFHTFFPHIISTFFPLLDAVVIGPELQLQGLEARMIPKQETLTILLTLMSQFLRA